MVDGLEDASSDEEPSPSSSLSTEGKEFFLILRVVENCHACVFDGKEERGKREMRAKGEDSERERAGVTERPAREKEQKRKEREAAPPPFQRLSCRRLNSRRQVCPHLCSLFLFQSRLALPALLLLRLRA